MAGDFSYIVNRAEGTVKRLPKPKPYKRPPSSDLVTIYGVMEDELRTGNLRFPGPSSAYEGRLMKWRNETGEIMTDTLMIVHGYGKGMSSQLKQITSDYVAGYQARTGYSVPAFEVVKCEGVWADWPKSSSGGDESLHPRKLVMSRPPVPAKDPELDGLSAKLQTPLVLFHPDFGVIELERKVERFEGCIKADIGDVHIYMWGEGYNPSPTALKMFMTVLNDFYGIIERAKARLVSNLDFLEETHWVRQTKAEITQEYFLENMRLNSMTIYSDDCYDLDFDLKGAPNFFMEVTGLPDGTFDSCDFSQP